MPRLWRRRVVLKRIDPRWISAICDSSSALWLAGEKAIKNSGKAISSAPRLLASLIKFESRLGDLLFFPLRIDLRDGGFTHVSLECGLISSFKLSKEAGIVKQKEKDLSRSLTLSLSEGFEMIDSEPSN